MKPYIRNNPRSVRGAAKRGWHVVTLPRNTLEKHNVSWLGLDIWASRQAQSYYVKSYQNRQFAFEREADASWFTMKWCI